MNYYDTIAAGYNALYEEEQMRKLQTVLPVLPKLIGLKLLDVGCGTGISSDFFADFGAEVTGIDPAQNLIAENKSQKSKLIKGVAEKLPFADCEFDIVVSFSAIQNFEDVQSGLNEIKRVGKKFFILTFMAKGNENLDSISAKIEKTFAIKHKYWAKNDIVFICEG